MVGQVIVFSRDKLHRALLNLHTCAYMYMCVHVHTEITAGHWTLCKRYVRACMIKFSACTCTTQYTSVDAGASLGASLRELAAVSCSVSNAQIPQRRQ